MVAYFLSITRINRSALLYIFAFSAVSFAYIGIASVLGNLYILGLGFDTAFLGTMTAAGQIVWALTALPAGEIGARFGLRGSIIAGYLLIVLFYMLYLNIPLLPNDLWAAGLMISNLGLWAAVSLLSVNGVPYLMAVTGKEERNKAFAFQAAVAPVAAFAGSLVGGFLPAYLVQRTGGAMTETTAYRVTLMIATTAYIASALLTLKARPVPSLIQSAKEAARKAAPVGLLVFLGVLFGLQVASEGALMTYLNVYFAEEMLLSTSLIGMIFAVVRLMPFFLSPLLPLALNRRGSGFTMNSAYVLVAISALVIASFHTWVVAGLAFLLASIASSFAMPARSLFGQQSVQPRWRTTVNAVSTISLAAGSALAVYIGGRVISQAGFFQMFLLSAVLALASVGLYIIRPRKKVDPDPGVVPADIAVEVQAEV